MSHLGAKGSKALLSNLGAPGRSAVTRRCSVALSTAPGVRYSSTEQKSHSFKGQMMESIQQRLAREKADRERIERERQESAGSKFLTQTFMFLFIGASAYYLGTKVPQPPSTASTLPLSATQPLKEVKASELQAAWADLVAIVGKENVSTNDTDLDGHSGSTWSSHPHRPEDRPFCVVWPQSTDEVSRIMKTLHERRIPVTGYSGGTSLEGHFAPTRGGVVIDFGKMARVLAINDKDLDAVVQPGLGWEALNDALSSHGLFFPPDPGPGAMIGGMIGTGCSGTNAYRYGTMKDWVISLTVVLADGTVVKTRQRPRKSSAGYDLTRLFVGSEGTLGLVTEATLKLAVRPASTSVAVSTFPTVRAAADCVAAVVGAGIQVAAVELLDDAQMKCINDAGMTTRSWKEAPTIFFKFAGTQGGVKEQVSLVQKLAKGNSATSFDFAKNEDEQLELWSARKEALWSTMAVKKEGEHVWTSDVAVPISRLPDIIEETKADLKRSGLFGTIVGHVGDGNFHTILVYSDAQRKAAVEFEHRMVKRAIEMEGTVTGEHGIGLVKRDYLAHELDENTVNLMRKMKTAFDPLCLLNCDKVVRMQKPRPGEVDEW
ncbi:uncharacterized protein PgNI_04359 [Pyricularia grisea]|uniref:D-lactate dehydrogenase (cytochrome) n=1 Tax=Pyricularia grisea TaxID=148305 RepID=A0A6P8B9F3_PYRGI|nr:uncharacterized protein PgNI_04359 [Pyricularia grisea]TLD12459.1 hypothetical protein PgNI_04359 [Pyricularia grisea]